MIAVKTLPRFKCDFCKKRSTAHVISKHEKRCFRNPNRYCDYCENLGYRTEYIEGYPSKVECPYCAKFNIETLQEIQKYEEKQSVEQEHSILMHEEVPF